MSSSFEYKTITITWLHHASFLFQAGGKNLYIDPFKISEGPLADYILVSHDHFDHFDEESIKVISQDTTKVVASSVVRKTNTVNITLDSDTPAKLDDWMVRSVPAYNVGKSFHQKNSGGCGFFIEHQGVSMYHAGDTDWIPEMSALHGKVDIALLPIGGTYTMDVDDAMKAVATISPAIVIPMHYNYIDETTISKEQLAKFVDGASAHCQRVVVLDSQFS